MALVAFILGVLIGGTLGILAMALIVSGRIQDDKRNSHYTDR